MKRESETCEKRKRGEKREREMKTVVLFLQTKFVELINSVRRVRKKKKCRNCA